jgi:secreted trypsin-like serine protease
MYRIFAVVSILCLPIVSAFAQPDCNKPRNFQVRGSDKIVGGRLALIVNWPGQVALRATRPSGSTYFCGGR